MPSYVDTVKRNPKTGKVEKTGSSLIGNVSRGAAGGYSKGPVSGLVETNERSLSGPVYAPAGSPGAVNIVPNSSPSPVLTNTPGGAGALPNSPFINGYNPAMPTGAPTGPQAVPSPAGPISAPLPSPGPQEAPNQQMQQQAVDEFIRSGAYQESLAQQGLQSGGAAAITPADVMVLQGFAGLAKSVTTTLAGFARDAAIASTVGGSQILAVQAVPAAASGVARAGAGAAGKAATNTATTAALVEVAKVTAKLGSLGFIIATIKSSVSSGNKFEDDSTAKVVEVGNVMNKLARSGDPNLMAEGERINALLSDVRTDANKMRAMFPYGVLSGSYEKKFNELDVSIAAAQTEYDNYVKEQAGNALLDRLGNNPTQQDIDSAKTFLNTQEEGLKKTELREALNTAQDVANTNAANAAAESERQKLEFQRQQTESQQAFQTSEREARQAYEQSVRDAANTQRQFDEDTATTSSEGGTLSFGLLGGGGSTEFVDRDTASKAYFDGKTYQELTPAQQRLLNLLKGKGN